VETEDAAPAGILLIEDDRDVRESIAEVLEEEGYRVSLAKTGVEGLEQLGKSRRLPAAIVLDLMMPVMDGWEFWSLQQGHHEWATIPVVVISADTNAKDKADALGSMACLRKPLDIDELLAILVRLTAQPAGAHPAKQVGATGRNEKDS
jgi:DNA-binding response OmpR family regulator